MSGEQIALQKDDVGFRDRCCELNPDYCELAAKRLGQQSLLAEDVA